MRRLGTLLIVAALGPAAVASPARAQDLQYTTVDKIELSGALGTVYRLFGGDTETTMKTSVKGGMMRTDSDEESTILDLENGRVISIDHKAKTYTIMTFAQMTEMMDRAMTEAKQEAAQQSGRPTEAPATEQPEGEVDLEYKLNVEPTGEKQKINGYDAERYFMTMETEATVTPEGEEAQKAGRLIVFSDMWNAENVPIADAMAEFYRSAPEAAARNREAMQSMAGVFATNPELEGAMKDAAEEAQKMSGFTLRNTTYMVLVPPDVEFDRQLVLEPKKKESGGVAKKALGGLLKGALGAKQEEQPAENAQPTQGTIMTMISETRDVKTANLSADLFQPPAGYTEKPMQMPGR